MGIFPKIHRHSTTSFLIRYCFTRSFTLQSDKVIPRHWKSLLTEKDYAKGMLKISADHADVCADGKDGHPFP
jgi:hypothetical protein